MAILECRRVRFGSPNDERAFFEWLGRINGIGRIKGVGDTLFLHVRKPLSASSLLDLLAIFRRYRISMRQLAQFSTATNRAWFEDSQKYWFKRVFAAQT